MSNNQKKEKKSSEKSLLNSAGLIKGLIIMLASILVLFWVSNIMLAYVDYVAEKKVQQVITQMNNQHMGETPKVELGGTTIEDTSVPEDAAPETMIEELTKSTVGITKYVEGADKTFTKTGTGSGVIVGDDNNELWIVTNYHVIEGARKITITFAELEEIDAWTKGYNKSKDIVVLSVPLSSISENMRNQIRVATINTQATAKAGETVWAIGDMFGQGIAVTKGIISKENARVEITTGYVMGMIQIDAALNKGNSGGALVNEKGELIGITTAKNTTELAENAGYVINIKDVHDDISTLCAKTARKMTSLTDEVYIGIEVLETNKGLLVQNIVKDGPAYNSDLCVGDYIIAINGLDIQEMADLKMELNHIRSGEFITLRVERPDGKTYLITEIKICAEKKP